MGSVLAGRPVRASGHEGAALAACQGAGFTFGSFVGLQEFGLGLSVAILLDATVVRAILMPAVMKLLGDWDGYLPARLRRVLRVPAERCPAPDGHVGFRRRRHGYLFLGTCGLPRNRCGRTVSRGRIPCHTA